MLSTSAFNALLKTLEEPPAHVKFIFATTEIRKVPVTVLSRCQRFDLRRIEPEVMMALCAGSPRQGRRADHRRRAGADHPRRRRVGARCDVAAGSGDQPWRGRNRRRSGARHAGAGRPGRVLDLFDLMMRAMRRGRCRNCRRNMPTGPIRWPCCAIWPRSRIGFPWSRSRPRRPRTRPPRPTNAPRPRHGHPPADAGADAACGRCCSRRWKRWRWPPTR
jgi:hypothetical protein